MSVRGIERVSAVVVFLFALTLSMLPLPAAAATGTLIVQAQGASPFTQFSFLIDGDTALAFDASGTSVLSLEEGTHSITAIPVNGFIPTLFNCSEVEVLVGGTTVCTISNDPVATFTVGGPSSGEIIIGGPPTTAGVLSASLPRAVWWIDGGSDVLIAGGYHISLDRFTIETDGSTVVDEHFDSAPPITGFPSFVAGTWTSAGGRAIADAVLGQQTTIVNGGVPLSQHTVTFSTNTNVTLHSGLRADVGFTVSATFDIASLNTGDVFGLTLSNNFNTNPATENTRLLLSKPASDFLIQLSNANNNTGATTNISSSAIDASLADAIRLSLVHEAGAHVVSAAYELIDDGVVIASGSLPGAAPIFNIYDFARAGVTARGAGTFESRSIGTYGSLALNELNGTWIYTSGATPAQQGAIAAIAPGAQAQDAFLARVGTNRNNGPLTVPITITLKRPEALSITTTSLPEATAQRPYSVTLSSSGGVPTLSWSARSVPPPGLSLNTATGQLSGTPTKSGRYTLIFALADSTGTSVTKTLELKVNKQLQIMTRRLPDGRVGRAYSETLRTDGGTGPFTWTLEGGALPAGLTLSNTGAIVGVPTSISATSFILKITDANGAVATRALTIAVKK